MELTTYTEHRSTQDASVNWDKAADIGRLEARYVRRCADYFVAYLSSQTGCSQACRMCHLTASGQTRNRDASFEELLDQARVVLDYYDAQPMKARTVHFNFMARGEPLASRVIQERGDELLEQLTRLAFTHGLRAQHLISTIYPKEWRERKLEDVFVVSNPELHYSIYSMSDRFRRRWLPKAQPVDVALDRLVSWQRWSQKIITLHHAYIADENESEVDVHAICDALEERRLMVNINIVRYNSFDTTRFGTEPSEEIIQRNAAIYRERLPHSRIGVISRVGFDVAASCGMFLDAEGR
jgi:23S rRNA (adenine2503-C2)-methyltransferase